MKWIFMLPIMLAPSCLPVYRFTDKLETRHRALFKQKALIVCAVDERRVWLTNLTQTQQYFLSGPSYVYSWAPGDTFVIDENLKAFYRLRHSKRLIPCFP